VKEWYVRVLLRGGWSTGERKGERYTKNKIKKRISHYIKLPPWRIFHYIKLLCNNCPYILKCQNKLIMKKKNFFYLCLLLIYSLLLYFHVYVMYAVYILFHYKFNEFSIDKQGSKLSRICYANSFIINIEFYFDSNDHNPRLQKFCSTY